MDEDDRLNFWNAILIAIVTVCAALVAWRASVSADAAGEEEATGKELSELQRKRRDAELLVDAKLKMFPNKFMERDGKSGRSSYNTRREVGQYMADQARTQDMLFEEHFQDAERFRTKTEKLLLGVEVFVDYHLATYGNFSVAEP